MLQPIEIRVEELAGAAPLSQALLAGPFVFVSGQIPRDPDTKTIPDGIEAQTRQALGNVARVLEAAGCGLDRVVKVTAHLTDLADRPAFNSVYREVFRPPYPTRTTVGSALEGVLVEVDVVALRADA